MTLLLYYLNQVNPLSSGLAEHLASVLKFKQLNKWDFLLKRGQVCHDICFITTGLLRCYFKQENKEISRWFMQEGNVIISIASFYQQVPSIEYIQAFEHTEIYYITNEELQTIYRDFPEFERTGRLLTEKYYQLWDEQIALLLLHTPEERYIWLTQHHPDWLQRVPAKYIASYLGISPVTLSRIRSDTFKKHLLRRKHF